MQLTAMTRVGDLPPQIKNELEQLDKYISTQHLIATTLNDDMKKHGRLVATIPSDVNFLHSKSSAVKLALKVDVSLLKELKTYNDELTEDVEKIMQLIIQLSTPGARLALSFHLNDYFVKKIKTYKTLLARYEHIIKEGLSAIDGMERSCNEKLGGTQDLVDTFRNLYMMFMEQCEALAKVHSEVVRLTQKNE